MHNMQHTAILRRCFGVKDSKKKVALVGCGISPTKQTKVPILQSQVQVQVCTSSFLQRVVFASPSSARRFSQDKTDKKPKRKASLASTTRTAGFCDLHMNPGFDFQEVFLLPTNPRPLEGLREGDINFPRYPLQVLSYIAIVLSSTAHRRDRSLNQNEPFSTAERSERVENFLFRATREYTEAGIEQAIVAMRRLGANSPEPRKRAVREWHVSTQKTGSYITERSRLPGLIVGPCPSEESLCCPACPPTLPCFRRVSAPSL